MMKKVMKELFSFNEDVPEMSSLLELEGAELEQIIGGLMAGTTCDTYSVKNCSELTSCGTFNSTALSAT